MKNILKIVGAIILALGVFYLLSKQLLIERGYWAVGGEIFVPMAIVAYVVFTIQEEKNEDKRSRRKILRSQKRGY